MPLDAAQQAQLRAIRSLDDSAIVDFSLEHEFLSNYSRTVVKVDGVFYNTAEHAFQAQKAANAADRARIIAAETPGEAKAIARKAPVVRGWFSGGRDVAMRKVLAAKVRVCTLDTCSGGRSCLPSGRALLAAGALCGAGSACARACLSVCPSRHPRAKPA